MMMDVTRMALDEVERITQTLERFHNHVAVVRRGPKVMLIC